MNAVEKIVARPITARKITGATLQSLPYSFPEGVVVGVDQSFNTQLLTLPKQLQQLGFTYVRNSLKTVYQGGSLVTLAANQFGTTYDAVTGLHAYEAEPAATNLALNSAGAAATWTVSNVTDAGTPITGFAASLAFGDNSVVRSAYKSVNVTTGVTYTYSVFVSMDDGAAPTSSDFHFRVPGGGNQNIALVTLITSGIYRVSAANVSAATASASVGIRKGTTDSARTFRVIGIQVETGARATSYIATAGATVTRAADVLSTATANIPGFNAAGYTLVVDGRMDVVTTVARNLCSLNDGSGNNRATVQVNASGTFSTFVFSGGVSQAATGETAAGTSRYKIAYSVAANSFLRAVNGTAGTADTAGSVPVAPNVLNIGHYGTSDIANGYIYGFKLIPVALNQAQTTAQTS